MNEFFAMGGYAFYVWGAYGVTALVFVIEVLSARSRRHTVFAEARVAAPEEAAQ